jgi:hypothetical protein
MLVVEAADDSMVVVVMVGSSVPVELDAAVSATVVICGPELGDVPKGSVELNAPVFVEMLVAAVCDTVELVLLVLEVLLEPVCIILERVLPPDVLLSLVSGVAELELSVDVDKVESTAGMESVVDLVDDNAAAEDVLEIPDEVTMELVTSAALVIDAMEDDTMLLERLDDTDAAVKLVLDDSVVAAADTLVVGPVDGTLTVRVASAAELLVAVVCVRLDA